MELVCRFYDYYCNPKLLFGCKLVRKSTLHRKKILGYVILDSNVIGSFQKLILISNCIFFFNTVKRMVKNGYFSALFVKLCATLKYFFIQTLKMLMIKHFFNVKMAPNKKLQMFLKARYSYSKESCSKSNKFKTCNKFLHNYISTDTALDTSENIQNSVEFFSYLDLFAVHDVFQIFQTSKIVQWNSPSCQFHSHIIAPIFLTGIGKKWRYIKFLDSKRILDLSNFNSKLITTKPWPSTRHKTSAWLLQAFLVADSRVVILGLNLQTNFSYWCTMGEALILCTQNPCQKKSDNIIHFTLCNKIILLCCSYFSHKENGVSLLVYKLCSFFHLLFFVRKK